MSNKNGVTFDFESQCSTDNVHHEVLPEHLISTEPSKEILDILGGVEKMNNTRRKKDESLFVPMVHQQPTGLGYGTIIDNRTLRRHSPFEFGTHSKLPDINSPYSVESMPSKMINGDLYRNYDINASMVVISNACPLRCTYCFERDRHDPNEKMSIKTVEETFYFLYYGAKRSNEELMITLFGGEPTTNIDAIEHFMKLAIHHSHELSINMNMITNGYIMTDRLYDIIDNYMNVSNMPFNVQISMDGIPEVQDTNRPTANGKGSSSRVVANIAKYKELFRNNKENLFIHSVTSPYGAHRLYETYKYVTQELGLTLWTCPVQDDGLGWTQKDIVAYAENLKEIQKDELEIYRKTGQKLHTPLNSSCEDTFRVLGSSCGAGTGYLGTLPNGDLWTCHHYFYNQDAEDYLDYRVGNVSTGIPDPFCKGLRQFRKVTASHEYNCSVSPNCSGCSNGKCYRCHAVNHEVNGHPFDQVIGNFCTIHNILQKVILDLDMARQEIDKEKDAINLAKELERNPLHPQNMPNIISSLISEIKDLKKAAEK